MMMQRSKETTNKDFDKHVFLYSYTPETMNTKYKKKNQKH